MKKIIDKFNFINIGVLIVFSIISVLILKIIIPRYCEQYSNIAILVVWLGTAIAISQYGNNFNVYNRKSNKVKTIIIIIIICYIIYFLSGLFLGYRYSPYSQNLIIIMKNIVYFLGIIVLKEYTRNRLLSVNNKKIIIVVITIFFILCEINFNKFKIIYGVNEQLFQYLIIEIIPIIAVNILCTYLIKNGGISLDYAYVIPTTIIKYVAPIFPNLDDFVVVSFKLLLIFIIIIYVNYIIKIQEYKISVREQKKENPFLIILVSILLCIFIIFIAGILTYKPIAIMSNSMSPTFRRGSVVIVKKINNHFGDIKIGDILEYKTENGTVIHRIVKIDEDLYGKYTFKTKGDANNADDNIEITEEQAEGIVKCAIPYIGYPSVFIAENIFKKSSFIVLK